MDKSIKIASVQMHVSNDNEKNLQTMEDCLKHIDNLFKDVDLVVFPELCSMSLDQTMEEQAEEIPGIISNLFSKCSCRSIPKFYSEIYFLQVESY